MRDADRFRLLGTYRAPRVRVGRVLSCEARDCDVIVNGYSTGRIPWPVGHPRARGGRPGLIVFGGLAAAVRRESNQAVGHWFGVGAATVARWREALGAAKLNAGSARLRQSVARDPDRRAKIAAAKRGSARPTPLGWVPNGIPWTEAADELVRTLPPAEAAERTGHPLGSVYTRRYELGVSRRREGRRSG